MLRTRLLASRFGAARLAVLLKAAGLSRAYTATVVVETLDMPARGRCEGPLSRDEIDAVRDECQALWNALDVDRNGPDGGERMAA